ncbi:hypothetical protein M426DRAFT_320752 [Hypoxylon sp. CI-4A]|nr:hypothetical protein M426DRAFT_320752 [Hypoxylon sp. CI-4A]
MSIELNWETLTGGPDGEALAERIRDFIHTKFQSVPLPRFIKSVTVHDFKFGNIPPNIVLKDICDPLPDFYEENPDAEDEEESEEDEIIQDEASRHRHAEEVSDAIRAAEHRRRTDQIRRLEGRGGSGHRGGSRSGTGTYTPDGLYPPHSHAAGLRSAPGTPDIGTPFLGLGVPTPGVPGGTANMHYFQSKLATTWSGTQTPLAAVAGAQHLNGWLEMGGPSHPPIIQRNSRSRGHSRVPSQSSITMTDLPPSPSLAPPSSATLAPSQHSLREKHSVSTLAPTSAGASRPPTRDPHLNSLSRSAAHEDALYSNSDSGSNKASSEHIAERTEDEEGDNNDENDNDDENDDEEPKKFREPRVDDLQAVFRIKYAGDIKLMLTAEILLDYPMPSFVGIPVKLNITGLTFDGVGVVAYIRKRVHFCFLSQEDAVAAVGRDDEDGEDGDGDGDVSGNGVRGDGSGGGGRSRARLGSLLQEVRVESEIGQREGAKQSLKNVGKVEKFVLEQVRRIFEEEFVYPSFWTFLV